MASITTKRTLLTIICTFLIMIQSLAASFGHKAIWLNMQKWCFPRNFTDIDYHLKAYGFLGTVYEVTLEFKIEDREQFKHYVSTLLGDRETTPFPFDDEWVEYVQSDKYSVYDHFYSDDPNITEPDVISCHIGKVLINYEKQRIFFVVMIEYDCDFYSYEYTDYFSRFNIDIGEYAKYTEQNDWLDAREKRRRALFKTGDGSLS